MSTLIVKATDNKLSIRQNYHKDHFPGLPEAISAAVELFPTGTILEMQITLDGVLLFSAILKRTTLDPISVDIFKWETYATDYFPDLISYVKSINDKTN